MKHRPLFLIGAAVLAVAVTFTITGRAHDKDGDKDKDKDKVVGVQELLVDFGRPGTVGGTPANHFVDFPNGTNVNEGGTVVFRVNQGGHGVSVYAVSKNTTPEDIQAGLCHTRSTCDAAFIAGDHMIFDGRGNVVVDTGTNPPFARVDDAGRILVGTAAQAAGEDPGRFHNGAPVAATPTAAAQSSERIRIKFLKEGRYLAICMNRNHSINDWMFGLFDVVEAENEKEP